MAEEIQEPPSWTEIESDPEYQGLPSKRRGEIFQSWRNHANSFAKSQGALDAELADFDTRALQRFEAKQQEWDAADFSNAEGIARDAFSLGRDVMGSTVLTRNMTEPEIAVRNTVRKREEVQPILDDALAYEQRGDKRGAAQLRALATDYAALIDRELPANQPLPPGSRETSGGGIEPIPEPSIRAEEVWAPMRYLGGLAQGLANDQGLQTIRRQPLVRGIENTAGATGGGIAGAALMTGLSGPLGVALPFFGALGGSMAGSSAQEAITQATESQEETQARQQRVSEEMQDPLTRAGSLLGTAAFFRPSVRMFGEAARGNAAAQQNIALGTGLGAAGPTAMAALSEGRLVTPGELAEGALVGSFFNQPTRLAQRIFGFNPVEFHPDFPSGTVRTPIGTMGPDGQIIEPGTPEGIALRSMRGLDATEPMRLDPPEVRDARQLVDEMAVEHTDDAGNTNWTAVRDSIQRIMPPETEGPAPEPLRAVMQNALRMAGERIPVEPSQPLPESIPPIAQDVPTESPETPVVPTEPVTPPVAENAPDSAPIAPEDPASEVQPEAPRPAFADPTILGDDVTGIRNAIVDPARQAAGLPARESVGRNAYPELWDKTLAQVAENPVAGRELVDSLKTNMRPLTDAQAALLTHEHASRENTLNRAIKDYNKADTPGARDDAQERMVRAQNELYDIYQVGQAAGTENARGLAARRILTDRNFNLTKMLAETQATVNQGEPLSPDQISEVKARHEEIQKLQSRITELETQAKAREADQTLKQVERQTKKTDTTDAPKRKTLIERMDAAAEAARKRIIERRGRLQATFDPLNVAGLVDEAIIGASYVAKGVKNFGKWSKQMVETFGERIRAALPQLWKESQNYAADEAEKLGINRVQTPEEVMVGASKEAGLTQKLVFDLTRAQVRAGKKGFEEVFSAVEKDLKSLFPDVTRRKIHDTLSEYGKVTFPNKAEDLTAVRELRTLARLQSQLEDARAKRAPLKTGRQRDKATTAIRDLERQVQAEMRKQGITTTSPDQQLATAHTQRVARLQNAAEDLQRQITAGVRDAKQTEVPWTAEELALQSHVDELRIRLDDVLNQPESDKLNSLLSRIEKAQDKIRTGKIMPESGRPTADTKAVAEASETLAKLNKEIAQMRKAERLKENPPKTQDEKDLRALEKRRDALLDRVRTGNLATRGKRQTADTEQQAAVRAEIEALNSQMAEMREAAKPKRPLDENQFRNLERRAAELRDRISRGDISTRMGKPTADTQRVAQARRELEQLTQRMAEMREAAKPQKPLDESQYKSLERRIADARARLAAGDFSTRGKTSTVDTQRVSESRAELDALTQQIREKRAAIRNTPEAQLERAKESVKRRTKEVEARIAANDYTERVKPERPMDEELLDLEYKLDRQKQQWNEGLIEVRRARRSTKEKVIDAAKEGFNASRMLMTSGDLPPIFRQGLFSIGRPVQTAKAFVDALKAMTSEKQRFRIQREIETRPNAKLYNRHKLYIAKDTANLSQQEEAYMGNWFKKLPRWTVVGPLLRASERSYTTFLNRLRADTFDSMVKAYDVASSDTATLDAVADTINTMTGRAKLPVKKLEQNAAAFNTFMFAPRLLASRMKLATMQPIWKANTAKSRLFATEQYARTLAGAAIIYGLARSAGLEIETDPRSSKFGKIGFGKDTYLDPMGGLLQVLTFLSRTATGETKTGTGKLRPLRETLRPLKGTKYGATGKPNFITGDTFDTIANFGRSKLAPIPGAIVNAVVGKDLVGQPVTAKSTAKSLFIPLSYQEILQAMERQGVPKGTALTMLNMLGMGLQNWDKNQPTAEPNTR